MVGSFACPRGFRQEVSENDSTNGIRLALHLERFELRGGKRSASPRKRLRGDPDLVLACSSHKARGKRGRVPENRVRTADPPPALPRKTPPPAAACVPRERQPLPDGRSERPENPLLVVSECLRPPRH